MLIIALSSFDVRHIGPCQAGPPPLTPADFAASSQACAAWAGFGAAIAAAFASTFVGIAAVFIAFWVPKRARITRIRASIYYVGHALAAVYVLRAFLNAGRKNALIPCGEVLDRIRPSITALEQFFINPIDDGVLIKLALNLQSLLLLFKSNIESMQDIDGEIFSDSALARMNLVGEALDSLASEFRRIARQYGLEPASDPASIVSSDVSNEIAA